LKYHNKVTIIKAFGDSSAFVDHINNLMMFGSNSHGQLGINSSTLINVLIPTKANKMLPLEKIHKIEGYKNTFAFLSKS
jgi:alpha-tubulin suppressor-like RCC1 family protein